MQHELENTKKQIPTNLNLDEWRWFPPIPTKRPTIDVPSTLPSSTNSLHNSVSRSSQTCGRIVEGRSTTLFDIHSNVDHEKGTCVAGGSGVKRVGDGGDHSGAAKLLI